jgi:hypothetical protein
MAPSANIILVHTPYPDNSLYMTIADMLNLLSSKPMIISLSWGTYEDALISYGINEQILAIAAAQGVPVFVASCDYYATSYPATSRYVTAVGGTALFSKAAGTNLYATPIYLFETGWGDYIPNATAFGTTFKLGRYLWGSGGGRVETSAKALVPTTAPIHQQDNPRHSPSRIAVHGRKRIQEGALPIEPDTALHGDLRNGRQHQPRSAPHGRHLRRHTAGI